MTDDDLTVWFFLVPLGLVMWAICVGIAATIMYAICDGIKTNLDRFMEKQN